MRPIPLSTDHIVSLHSDCFLQIAHANICVKEYLDAPFGDVQENNGIQLLDKVVAIMEPTKH